MDRFPKRLPLLTVILICGAAAAGVMLLLMQGMMNFTYDDYYYAVFLRDGLSGFIGQNITHYLVRNGRVLVHVAAELLLAGGTWVYSLCNLLILAGVLALGLRYLEEDRPARADLPLLIGGGAAMVMAVNGQVLRSWLLCPADSVNYMLPLAVIFGMLLALRRGRPIAAAVLSLLCGATTELCAATGFVLAALELVYARVCRGRWDRLRLVCLALTLCGLATILLSPATQERVGSELSLSGIGFSFLCYANSIASPGTSLTVLTAVSLLLGWGDKPWLRRQSAVVALVLASGWFLPRSTLFTAAAFTLLCIHTAVCAAVMTLEGRNRRCGFSLLAGLCSAAIMSLSQSSSVRVTIPFLLILMLVGLQMLRQLCSRFPGRKNLLRAAAALALWAALLLHIPDAAGLAGNWRIMQQNEAAMTPELVTYTDYDPRYSNQPLFSSTDFERVYLRYLGLEGAAVRYNHCAGPQVLVEGTAHPSILWQGRIYVPLRAAVEAAGGTVEKITDNFLEIRLGSKHCIYQNGTLHTPSGRQDAVWDFFYKENSTYISTQLLEQVWQLNVCMGED